MTDKRKDGITLEAESSARYHFLAECMPDIAHFILALDGRRGSMMLPQIVQASVLGPIGVYFYSLLSLDALSAAAATVTDGHRIMETLRIDKEPAHV